MTSLETGKQRTIYLKISRVFSHFLRPLLAHCSLITTEQTRSETFLVLTSLEKKENGQTLCSVLVSCGPEVPTKKAASLYFVLIPRNYQYVAKRFERDNFCWLVS